MSGLEQFASGQGRRVLIVDDDEAVLAGLGEYFGRLGYEVVRAATGRQGLDGFESQEPDVTILDLRLPDIDGMQILEIMRRKRALVILLTGYGDIPTAVRAMQLGAENFLTKPVDLAHLVATVEHALEKLELRRENVRLRQMIPSTRRRALLAVTALLLIAAAVLVGWFIGNVGNTRTTPREIAPVQSEAPAAERAPSDSTATPPGPATAPASRTPVRRP
jgi:FixJ family two-component response regulator